MSAPGETDRPFAGRVAFITGAAHGQGRAVALALAESGADIVAFDVAAKIEYPAYAQGSSAELDSLVAEVHALGRRALAFVGDVRDSAAIQQAVDAAIAEFGRIDVLFNNAGSFAPAVTIDALTVAQWRAVVDVNLTGAFLCAQAAFRMMRTQRPMGGRIINNGSISAAVPRPFSAPYTATKHAITGLTKSLSLDGRAFDIACSQIDIGNAATSMTEPRAQGAFQADGSVKPEPRMDVSHVADAVVYMAQLPLCANVQFMTIMATKMPFIGRG